MTTYFPCDDEEEQHVFSLGPSLMCPTNPTVKKLIAVVGEAEEVVGGTAKV